MPTLDESTAADRSAALDALSAESQRLGLYDVAPDHFSDTGKMVAAMVEAAADALPHNICTRTELARAALESLGVDLAVLAELKAGKRKAVRIKPCTNNTGPDVMIGSDVFLRASSKRYTGGPATVIGYEVRRGVPSYRLRRHGDTGKGARELWVRRGEFGIPAPKTPEAAR